MLLLNKGIFQCLSIAFKQNEELLQQLNIYLKIIYPLMESLNIYLKPLSGGKIKEQVFAGQKIIEIRTKIAQQKGVSSNLVQLKFKNKDLEDQKTFYECGIKHGDDVILMIKKLPLEKNAISNITSKGNNEQLKELIELGYNELAIQEALVLSNNDYSQALCFLAKQQEQLLEEEVQEEIPTHKEIYKSLLKEQIVKELRSRVNNEGEWNKTIERIKSQNNQIYNLIYQNQEEFRHLIVENQESNLITIDENDLDLIFQFRQFRPDLSDKQLMDAYIQNNRNEYDTLSYLDQQ